MDKKVLFYILLGIMVLGLVLITIFPGIIHAIKDSGVDGNSVAEKCKPAPGYKRKHGENT